MKKRKAHNSYIHSLCPYSQGIYRDQHIYGQYAQYCTVYTGIRYKFAIYVHLQVFLLAILFLFINLSIHLSFCIDKLASFLPSFSANITFINFSCYHSFSWNAFSLPPPKIIHLLLLFAQTVVKVLTKGNKEPRPPPPPTASSETGVMKVLRQKRYIFRLWEDAEKNVQKHISDTRNVLSCIPAGDSALLPGMFLTGSWEIRAKNGPTIGGYKRVGIIALFQKGWVHTEWEMAEAEATQQTETGTHL